MNRLCLRALALTTLMTFYACGSSDEPELASFSTSDTTCEAGDEQPCLCDSGAIQSQTCEDGKWSECDCPACGNGKVEVGEQCDGTDLAGEDCASYTMNAQPDGELRCGLRCSFDVSGCTMGSGGTMGGGGTFGGGGLAL